LEHDVTDAEAGDEVAAAVDAHTTSRADAGSEWTPPISTR